MSICAMLETCKQKPQNYPSENVSYFPCILEDRFMAVACMLSQSRKEKSHVAEQSFGLYNTCICIHHIVFELCTMKKEGKEDKQN